MQELIKDLIIKNNSRIIFIVLDGLGGLPINGKTELEGADIPNLNALAKVSATGLHITVSMGITPGSGPGHLSLFGYDPIKYPIGRGILEALGLGLEVKNTDIAIRGNYATLKDGIIVDRRAGRISSEENRRLTEMLQKEIAYIDGVQIIFRAGMEHRFAVVMRFPEPLQQGSDKINDTDPQKEGKSPLPLKPSGYLSERVIRVAERFISGVEKLLKTEKRANYILLRGFSQMPDMPSFKEIYCLNALAIATYPMYRGIARLMGMSSPQISGELKEELNFLHDNYSLYDFIFFHVKKIDSYAEDGDFEGKIKKIEEFDKALPEILTLNPDVLVITGDHSTPSILKSHSWHPVPVLLRSPFVLGGISSAFTERECLKGELGIFPTINLMPLLLANAGRLKKFGA